jgi:hypothetical protein
MLRRTITKNNFGVIHKIRQTLADLEKVLQPAR